MSHSLSVLSSVGFLVSEIERAAGLRSRMRSLGRALAALLLLGNLAIPVLADEAEEPVEVAAGLSLHAVHPENVTLAQKVADDDAELPAGNVLLAEPQRDQEGEVEVDDKGVPLTTPILVEQLPKITNSQIAEALPDLSRPGMINITLTEAGGEAMKRYTATIVPGRDRIAQVFNGKVISAPGFITKNLGKRFTVAGISGGIAGAKRLCEQIKATQKTKP